MLKAFDSAPPAPQTRFHGATGATCPRACRCRRSRCRPKALASTGTDDLRVMRLSRSFESVTQTIRLYRRCRSPLSLVSASTFDDPSQSTKSRTRQVYFRGLCPVAKLLAWRTRPALGRVSGASMISRRDTMVLRRSVCAAGTGIWHLGRVRDPPVYDIPAGGTGVYHRGRPETATSHHRATPVAASLRPVLPAQPSTAWSSEATFFFFFLCPRSRIFPWRLVLLFRRPSRDQVDWGVPAWIL